MQQLVSQFCARRLAFSQHTPYQCCRGGCSDCETAEPQEEIANRQRSVLEIDLDDVAAVRREPMQTVYMRLLSVALQWG